MKQFFLNMTISRKLLAAFFVITVFCVLVGFIGSLSINSSSEGQNTLFNNIYKGTVLLEDSQKAFLDIRVQIRTIILFLNDDKTKYYDAINVDYLTLKNNADDYEKLITGKAEKEQYASLKTSVNQYIETVNAMINASKNGASAAELLKMAAEGTAVGNATYDEFGKMISANTTQASQLVRDLSDNNTRSIYVMILITVLSIVCSILISSVISRMIVKPLTKIVLGAEVIASGDIQVDKVLTKEDFELKLRKDEIGQLASVFNLLISGIKEKSLLTQKLSDGDLTVELSARSDDDILGNSLISLVNKMNDVIGSIVMSADQVSVGAHMMAESSVLLSQGATEQASTIQELSASVTEITRQTDSNAENASKAKEMANTAKSNAETGNQKMAEMLTAMEKINDASRKISKVIKVIDDIAFQTNILALNAAVEAARAGQHGKGFAVVAEEVRTLASKSANAVKETSLLIEDSISKVESGFELAQETAKSFNLIVGQIDSSADLVETIASASKSQANDFKLVAGNITQIAQVVNTNAAAAEECAAASEELSNQALVLIQTSSIFKTREKNHAVNIVRKQPRKQLLLNGVPSV